MLNGKKQLKNDMYLRVRITPSAKHESITQKGEVLLVTVKEPAAQNRANNRLRELVAEKYGLSVSGVRILHGHHSPSKLLSLEIDTEK